MGQGIKNQSRHQQITKNRENIVIVFDTVKEMLSAWAQHIERGESGDPLLTHKEIDGRLDIHGKLITDLLGSLNSLSGLVLFNAQPFWKRWWQTWRRSISNR
jgi:hypothetical protein